MQKTVRLITGPRWSLKEMKAIPPYRGPKKALVDLLDEVESKLHLFRKECWNITCELIADHLGIIKTPWKYSIPDAEWTDPLGKPSYHNFKQLKEQINPYLIETYVRDAKADPWDYLGDIFCEEELAGTNRLGQMLTPRSLVEMMTMMALEPNLPRKYSLPKPDLETRIWLTREALSYNDKLAEISINLQAERARRHTVQQMQPILTKYDPDPEPVSDLDPATGTGRFLLVASLMYPESPLLLYGIEIDLFLYRACLVNMAMFSNHPYSIICADTLMLNPDLSGPGGDLWTLGNRWNPPDISEYYCKPSPINAKHFSLKYFVGLKNSEHS